MNRWPAFTGANSVREVEARPLSHWIPAATVPEMIASSAAQNGDVTAHRFLSEPGAATLDQSFAGLAAAARRYASVFAAKEARPVVASLLPGLPETLPLLLGAMWAGTALPINPFLEPSAIIHMLEATGATVLLAEGPAGTQGVYDKLPEIVAALPELQVVICGETETPVRGEPLLGVWCALLEQGAPKAPLPSPAPEDIAAYFHTGGTTGVPKIARLSHFNLAFMSYLTGFAGGMRRGDTLPCGMPLFHVGGLVFGGLAPFVAGACVVQLGREGYRNREMTAALWDIARSYRADILFAPPTVALAAMESFTPPLPESARYWVSSAAPLPAAAHRRFTAATGLPVKEAWGLTEATLLLSFTPPEGEGRPGSVGLRLPFCEVTIRAFGAVGREAETGEPGIVMARSPGLFSGYLGHDHDGLEALPQPLGGRWLNTGDVGYFDSDGYLYLTGRAKDMILRGGHNIDPATIEDAFMAQPEVADCAAVARPDARVGELPVCYVVLASGAEVGTTDLMARACAGITERAAHPKEIYLLAALPRTAVGKTDKVALRRDAAVRAVSALYPTSEIAARSNKAGQIEITLTPCPPNAAEQLATLSLILSSSSKGPE